MRILFIGATGYIGGSILSRLLTHPKRDTFDIKVLIRDSSKAKAFESFGLKVVIGSLSDSDVLESLSNESNIVFQCADSDHEPPTLAILRGLKKKYEETNVPSIYIHTSGIGSLIDDAQGAFAGEVMYSDLDVAKIEEIPTSRPHRNVDTIIVAADQEGYVKSYIACPSIVWGLASNVFTEINVSKIESFITPMIVSAGFRRGIGMKYGEGLNVWCHINIEECGDFYYILFDRLLANEDLAHGREGFYFIENGEFTSILMYEAFSKALFEAGKAKNDKPTDLTEEEKGWYAVILQILGSNGRAHGDRARSIGWKPVLGTEDMLASLKSEADYWLNKTH